MAKMAALCDLYPVTQVQKSYCTRAVQYGRYAMDDGVTAPSIIRVGVAQKDAWVSMKDGCVGMKKRVLSLHLSSHEYEKV